MSNNNTASCPFCGSRDVHLETFDGTWKFAVRCGGCRARGPEHRTLPAVWEGWNTRNSPFPSGTPLTDVFPNGILVNGKGEVIE